MSTENQEDKLSDHDKQVMASERKKARLFLEVEAEIQAQRDNDERVRSMHRMSSTDFNRLKSEMFAQTEAAKLAKLNAERAKTASK